MLRQEGIPQRQRSQHDRRRLDVDLAGGHAPSPSSASKLSGAGWTTITSAGNAPLRPHCPIQRRRTNPSSGILSKTSKLGCGFGCHTRPNSTEHDTGVAGKTDRSTSPPCWFWIWSKVRQAISLKRRVLRSPPHRRSRHGACPLGHQSRPRGIEAACRCRLSIPERFETSAQATAP